MAEINKSSDISCAPFPLTPFVVSGNTITAVLFALERPSQIETLQADLKVGE
jgi:hypothetical protein